MTKKNRTEKQPKVKVPREPKRGNAVAGIVAALKDLAAAVEPVADAVHDRDPLDAAAAIIHAGAEIAEDIADAAPEDHKAATAGWIMALVDSGIGLVRHFVDEDEADKVERKLKGQLVGHPLERKGRTLAVHVPSGADHAAWRPVVVSLVEAAGHRIEGEEIIVVEEAGTGEDFVVPAAVDADAAAQE